MSVARWLVFSVFLALPTTAWAQDERLTERLDPATASQVQQVVDSARRGGLPGEPLVQKALEGGTLGASDDRIVAAVQTLHGQLRRAREALGGQASDAELTAAAGALRAGLRAERAPAAPVAAAGSAAGGPHRRADRPGRRGRASG